MSAYAAVLEGSVFDDGDVIKYEQNSSDESENELVDAVPAPPAQKPFRIDRESVVFDGTSVILGLELKRTVMILGQYELFVERGAVVINGVHYYRAPQKFAVIQTNLQSIPTITSTEIATNDGYREPRHRENDELFGEEYATVLRIQSIDTSITELCKYHTPFKNLFTANTQNLQKGLTFEIISDNSISGITFETEFIHKFNALVKTVGDVSSFITIGNKNSGKSTVSKTLMNALVASSPVSYLDLDPGQSEFSKPYCLSITNHHVPSLGVRQQWDEDDLHFYYGFTNPQSNPTLYFTIIKTLHKHYVKYLKPKGHHLVINTPGWIKGYGKELLIKITELVDPDNLILLTANAQDNDTILQNLKFKHLHLLKGFFIRSRYSASDIRNFNKLVYFHRSGGRYNFDTHLLDTSPLKISYETSKNDQIHGVGAVSIINYDTNLDFNIEDLPLMLDASIVGMYLVDNELFQSQAHLLQHFESNPPYLNSSRMLDMIDFTESIKFVGLGLIHSINTIDNYFNIYYPAAENIDTLKQLMMEGYKLVFIKGQSEIPQSEVLMPQLLKQHQTKYKKAAKTGRALPRIPYVSYSSNLGGVWRIRRNVMRRGHLRNGQT